MEKEKKEKKKSSVVLITVLIIILLVAAVGGGFLAGASYIASKSLEKKKEVKEVQKAQEEAVADDESNALSNEEALKLGNELWKYAYSSYWGGEPVWKSHTGEVNEAGGRPIVCDTTIDEVKKKYAKDFQYTAAADEGGNLDAFIALISNGMCSGAARGADQLYKTTTLEIKKIEENKIVFDATSEYCGSSFCQESKETEKKVIKDFVIVKEQDQWLINSFYLPN